jgi:hypothetical protein
VDTAILNEHRYLGRRRYSSSFNFQSGPRSDSHEEKTQTLDFNLLPASNGNKSEKLKRSNLKPFKLTRDHFYRATEKEYLDI